MIAFYEPVYVSHYPSPVYITYNMRKIKQNLSINVMTNNRLAFDNPATDKFNFDLERMQKALESPLHTPPDNLSFQEFDQWIHQIAQES